MWFLPLLLLPALVSAQISIEIVADNSGASKVEYFGASVEIVNDQDIQTFGLTDEKLKDATERFSGGRPADVFLKSPTPWNDLYKTYGWSQVQRTLYPKSARVLGIRSEPVLLTTSEFINNSSVKSTYNAAISQEVQDTVSKSWSTGGDMSVKQEINYKVEVGIGELGGSTSFAFSSSWGKDDSKSKSITVGSSQGVQVELEPGQAVIASLEATRGTVEIQVDYTASLGGHVACNYPQGFRGHFFWRYDLNAVQTASNMRKTVESTETIKIGFYSNARVIVSDKVTTSKLASFAAVIS